MIYLTKVEATRIKIQASLDSLKTQKERNVLGQFSTPKDLSDSIIAFTEQFLDSDSEIRFIDPAIGTGVFYSSITRSSLSNRLQKATGFEIDPHYGLPAQELWSNTSLNIHLDDFTKHPHPKSPEKKYNLLVCNPPYVRHHHLNGEKERLQAKAFQSSGIELSGLSGLYCYFMAIAHNWMLPEAILAWLVPSEFMTVNYGLSLKNYLLNKVELLQIHRFDPKDSLFDDALVSSSVVCYRMRKSSMNHQVKFTFGGSLQNPKLTRQVSSSELTSEKKWTRFPQGKPRKRIHQPILGDYFSIKRGIATGDNKFFILSRQEIEARNLPIDQFRPILPSPRYLKVSEVEADEQGNPTIDRQLFVLNCTLPIKQIKKDYPNLFTYLEMGIEIGVSNRYLCKNRKTWYFQENRNDSRFYCTYIGRSNSTRVNPFRFILNHSKAIVSNSYLILYPKPNIETLLERMPDISASIFETLNRITGTVLSEEGRVYGGGMHKLEPKELANVPVIELEKLILNKKYSVKSPPNRACT